MGAMHCLLGVTWCPLHARATRRVNGAWGHTSTAHDGSGGSLAPAFRGCDPYASAAAAISAPSAAAGGLAISSACSPVTR